MRPASPMGAAGGILFSVTASLAGGFHYRLGQGWVGVDRGGDFFLGGFETFGEEEFGVAFDDFGLAVGGEEIFPVSGDADGDEDFVGFEGFGFVGGEVGECDFRAVGGGFDFFGFGFEADVHAPLFEKGEEAGGNFF